LCCVVNIDPIIPLATDDETELNELVDACKAAGVQYVFGAPLRLRTDIWERIKQVLRLLDIYERGIELYKKIYGFEEPLCASYVTPKPYYTNKIMSKLEGLIKTNGMIYDFPDHLGPKKIDKSSVGQITLQTFLKSTS